MLRIKQMKCEIIFKTFLSMRVFVLFFAKHFRRVSNDFVSKHCASRYNIELFIIG